MGLTPKEKDIISQRARYDPDKAIPCLRCDKSGHFTKACRTPARYCWQSGAGEFSDPEEAEKIYQTAKSTDSQKYPSMPRQNQYAPHSRARDARPESSRANAAGLNVAAPKGVQLKNYEVQPICEPHESKVDVYNRETDRLDKGSKALPVIMSNYLRIETIPNKLYVYSLSFHHPNPKAGEQNQSETLPFNKRSEIMSAFHALVNTKTLDLEGKVWATDYKSLWCTSELFRSTENTSNKHYGPCKWARPGGNPIDDLSVTVGQKEPLQNIRDAFTSKTSDKLVEEITALNAIISRAILGALENVVQVGANKFFLTNGYVAMGGGLRAQRGYFTSIRPSKQGTLLNINTATAAFIPPVLVSKFLYDCEHCGVTAPNQTQKYVEKLLSNKRVRISYERKIHNSTDLNTEDRRSKNFLQFGLTAAEQKFYKIDRTREQTDSQDPGTTVFTYFNRELEPPIAIDRNTVCVNVGKKVAALKDGENRDSWMRKACAKGAIWIPASLLQILPNQTTNALLSAAHTSEMIGFAARRPGHNATLIDVEGLVKLGIKGSQEHLTSMDVSVGKNLISFAAQILGPPKLYYGNKESRLQSASWNLANDRFSLAKPINALHVLGLYGALGVPQLEAFASDMTAQLKHHGVHVGPRESSESYVATQEARNLAVELDIWFKYTDAKDCTVVILQDRHEETYAEIKRSADLFHGMQTLCVSRKKIGRSIGDMSNRNYLQYLSNLALKVNMKAQGVNHKIEVVPPVPNFKRERTIVMGADVTHPGASGASGSPSIACVVGSIDAALLNYPGSMRLQAGGQEAIEDMYGMVKERLRAWYGNNKNQLPDHMLFYRDGISESQFSSCEQHEISAIRRAYQDLSTTLQQTSKTLKLTFVIVGKRHHTRFYPTSAKDTISPRNSNLQPGLYVDRIVTDPARFNFYLQSHSAIQGTARSAHYHVLVDEIGFGTGQELPNITHGLCYAFARATKGVSYVAPAYIADRLCERGRVYLRSWNHGVGFPMPDMGKDRDKDRARGPGKTTSETRDAALRNWKKDCALKLARSEMMPLPPLSHDDMDRLKNNGVELGRRKVWGMYNEDVARGEVRMNPWHPNLDLTMFWM